MLETEENESVFSLPSKQGRASGASTALPIWANVSFKPVRIRSITGEAELLLRIGIIKKIHIGVFFGIDRVIVGNGVVNDYF